MLLVKTRVQPSTIRGGGLGLFADENIPARTVIWKIADRLSFIVFTEEQWQNLATKLSKESFLQIRRYAYKDNVDGLYYLNLDDSRFENHSTNPNMKCVGDDDIATRDIRRGEELVIDYRTFYDPAWFEETLRL